MENDTEQEKNKYGRRNNAFYYGKYAIHGLYLWKDGRMEKGRLTSVSLLFLCNKTFIKHFTNKTKQFIKTY